MSTIPTTEPTEIIAGDFLTWKKSYTDYPATTHTLSYKLVGSSVVLTITASASGDDHLVEVESAVTALYTAGTYQMTSYVTETSTSRRTTLTSSTIDVVADPGAETATDKRTWAALALAAIKVILQDPAKIAQKKVEIEGKMIEWRSFDELRGMYSFYAAEVAREQAQENLGNGISTGGRYFMKL